MGQILSLVKTRLFKNCIHVGLAVVVGVCVVVGRSVIVVSGCCVVLTAKIYKQL